MSGETSSDISGWTTDTLRAHIEALLTEMNRRNEQRFVDQEKALLAALTAAKEAVHKAEVAAEKRLDSVNEFRGQLADQAATFMSRSETQLMFSALSSRVDKVEESIDRGVGRAKGIAESWGYLVAAVGLAGAIVAVILAFN